MSGAAGGDKMTARANDPSDRPTDDGPTTSTRAVERQDPNPTADRTIRPASRGWRLVLAAGLVAVVVVTFLDGRAHDVGFVAIALGAAGAAAVPWLRLRSRVPVSIVGLAAGLA